MLVNVDDGELMTDGVIKQPRSYGSSHAVSPHLDHVAIIVDDGTGCMRHLPMRILDLDTGDNGQVTDAVKNAALYFILIAPCRAGNAWPESLLHGLQLSFYALFCVLVFRIQLEESDYEGDDKVASKNNFQQA